MHPPIISSSYSQAFVHSYCWVNIEPSITKIELFERYLLDVMQQYQISDHDILLLLRAF